LREDGGGVLFGRRALLEMVVDMKALITGGAGFIGSHLSELLLRSGHEVTVIDDLSTGSLSNLAPVLEHRQFEFVRDSVRNETVMAILVNQCDVVFHLAAAVGVGLIVKAPVRTLETNIHGTEVTLGLANKFRRKILIASTSEVYGKNSKVPFREDDDTVLGPTTFSRWSYACSKMVDEFLALAYHDQWGLPVVISRLFNTVGPRQTGQYGMVVPRFVQKALRGEEVEIYGTGKQSRCFTNVSDVVHALVKLMECPAANGEVVNIGSTEAITIEDLADKIIAMTHSKSAKRHLSYEEAYGRPFDDLQTRVPDLSKAGRLIGYKPGSTLTETLQTVIDYERTQPGK
jgi:UDP-glucose 4-epimerase